MTLDSLDFIQEENRRRPSATNPIVHFRLNFFKQPGFLVVDR